jgi:hypothetical protein
MGYDLCLHQITQIILRAGEIIRETKGLPPENNVTILFEETAPLFGIETKKTNSMDADRLPTVADKLAEKGITIKCPKCEKPTYRMFGICPSCSDSENGKYATKFICSECGGMEKSVKPVAVWLDVLGIDPGERMISKEMLGIKTITDEGIK